MESGTSLADASPSPIDSSASVPDSDLQDAGPSPMDAGSSLPDGAQPLQLDQAQSVRTPASAILPGSLDAAVAANNAFAVGLYAQVDNDAGETNVLTSPLSASLALTMAYAGAEGQTATQMAAALQFDPDAGSSIFDGQNALTQALASRGAAALAAAQIAEQGGASAPSASDYELEVVNSVWGEQTFPWAAPFLNVLATSYGTGVYLEDFIDDPDPARLAINAWVSAETADKINNLLPEGSIDSSTRIVLVNAIHLKLPWANPFEVSATAPGTFTRGDGTTVSASFMNETLYSLYDDDGQAQIVGLPLSNNELWVVIALPHQGVSLATYEASLGPGSAALVGPSTGGYVAISLPKVTFTSPTFSLRTALQAMGMIEAFIPGSADFLGLCPAPDGAGLYVSDVLQKATIAMQETGVEAAAATAVIGGDSVVPPPPVPMTVDRPYLVAIVDMPTGAILFLGHIEDPTDSGGP
jgi:serpin B